MGARTEIQVSRRKTYTHIHLDYVRIEFLSYINNKKSYYIFKLKKGTPKF